MLVIPPVGALDVAFILVHGLTSYTRCCNDAVNPLVGDVVGVTEVQGLRFSARFVSDGAGELTPVSPACRCSALTADCALFTSFLVTRYFGH